MERQCDIFCQHILTYNHLIQGMSVWEIIITLLKLAECTFVGTCSFMFGSSECGASPSQCGDNPSTDAALFLGNLVSPDYYVGPFSACPCVQ